MKTFIIKSILFAILALTIFFGIAFNYKQPIDLHNDYMAAMIDKHYKLEHDKDHRLILVGGSNLAFGINSEKLEKELKLPVTNLGLHGGLGLEFMLNEVISEVKTGDVIVLSLEYSLYDPENDFNVELINQTQQLYPNSKSYYQFTFKDWIFMNYRNFKKSFNNPKTDTTSIYNRKSFNAWGDVIAHITKTQPTTITYEGKLHPITSIHCLEQFKALDEKCKLLGAKLYLAFPNYVDTEYKLNKNEIENLEQLIKKELSFIPIINKPETFVYDSSYFYDTCYHLNGKGRERRTDTLISILKKTFDK